MQFEYKATTNEGKIAKGVIEAKDKTQAAVTLRARNFFPISIAEKKTAESILSFLPFFKSSHSAQIVFFTSQLSSMLGSGLTLLQALAILKNQTQDVQFATIQETIISDIEEGRSFSQAIQKHPEIFSPIYIALIKAAEASGLLDKVLSRLAINLEKGEKLKATIKSALMYPAIIVIGMVSVVTIMMIFVIPQLAALYENLDIPLPLPTQIIIGMSTAIIYFWPIFVPLIGLSIFLFKRWHQTNQGRLVVDSAILKMPIFGKLQKQLILTEFCRTLGLLVGSGTLIVDAFHETSNITGNILYKNAILDISKKVEKGLTIGDAMISHNLFPPLLLQMVKIGEQTGKLDESLIHSSEYFEREVDDSVKTLTTALEPIIMVVLGVGVAFLIISIITPIYNLTSAIQ